MGKEGDRTHPAQRRSCKKPHHGKERRNDVVSKKSYLETVWAAPKIASPSTPYTELAPAQKRERIRAALAMVIEYKKQLAAGTSKKDLEKARVWGSYAKVRVLTSLCALAGSYFERLL